MKVQRFPSETARRLAVASAASLALFATACGYGPGSGGGNAGTVQPAGGSAEQGDDGSGYGAGSKSSDGYGSSGASAQGGSRTGAAGTLAVRDVPDLGEVTTDSAGWTLYRFDEDSANPPRSSCEGDCAEAWPPVPAKGATEGDGVRSGKLGKVQRADGSWQLALGGWPVYRYAKDTAPGDTKGQGVGGTWHALAPTGAKAGERAGGAESGGAAAQLKAVNNADLGKILEDAEGRTLYRFDKDTAWPMKSHCTGACLDTWKPAKPVSEEKLSGVTKKAVGTYKRPDGTRQLTIDCWPVYWFTGDTRPGDVNGQNKQGLWHAVTPEGKKAKGSPTTDSGSSESGSESSAADSSASDSGNSGSGSDTGTGY